MELELYFLFFMFPPVNMDQLILYKLFANWKVFLDDIQSGIIIISHFFKLHWTGFERKKIGLEVLINDGQQLADNSSDELCDFGKKWNHKK